jgi:hypothetical protein
MGSPQAVEASFLSFNDLANLPMQGSCRPGPTNKKSYFQPNSPSSFTNLLIVTIQMGYLLNQYR